MKIVIIDYGAGNIKSIQFAFERLGYQAILSNNAKQISDADRVIFPGVGEASSAMNKLRDTGLDLLIPKLEQPVLGICLGMQLMCISSKENNTKGLGIFNVEIEKFTPVVKVPQIGWNNVTDLKSPLFKGIKNGEYMYLVHSYYATNCRQMIASTTYGIQYASALRKDNFYGVQFHPEKSGVAGEQLLSNFLKL